jgi:DNA processing protein
MRSTRKPAHRDDLRCLLAFSFIKDVGPVTIKRLLAAFPSAESIFEASFEELRRTVDIKEVQARRIADFAAWDLVDKELEQAEQKQIKIIACTDNDYPEALRAIDGTPPVLYMKGSIQKDDTFALAMVGSRMMSDYGRMVAHTLSFELASRGLTIVSGMARGIDTVSHKGALKAGGRSIAVLGCGLDRPYPPENAGLFEELSLSGCVISEFPLGTPPNRENFPQRNRVISGLSLGVLVVEATRDSGSLITAQYALDQGKEVFAVPGKITTKTSDGTNALIKKGARPVHTAEDIIEELSSLLKGLLRSRSNSSEQSNQQPSDMLSGLEISDEERAICTVLDDEPKHIDVIARELAMAPSKLLGLLLALELKGIVKQTEGKNFHILFKEGTWRNV